MTTYNTIEQLRSLRLHGMAAGLDQQLTQPAFLGAAFEQRLQMLVDAETSHRDTKKYTRILKRAKLKIQAMPEDIDFRPSRGIEKSLIAELLSCAWVIKQRNLLMTGPTGT
ncbi:TPA: ATP-binding protein, partial [Citrobacter farmeri]